MGPTSFEWVVNDDSILIAFEAMSYSDHTRISLTVRYTGFSVSKGIKTKYLPSLGLAKLYEPIEY